MKIILKILLSILLLTFTSNVNASSEKLTIGLDWFINPDHAPIIIAKKRNFFKDLNLEVEMIEPADPNEVYSHFYYCGKDEEYLFLLF